ncbi:MAG: hypothetical protein WC386_01770 [Candidatus Paceibacterota bacterium]|jgi:hypothetical protein
METAGDTSSILIAIITGVISGVITAVIIQFIIRFFNNTVIPWYQTIIYKGVNISGTWEGFQAEMIGSDYVPEQESESTINLEQKGNRISGELLLTKQPNGDKCRKSFKLDGFFIDNILTLRNEVKENRTMGVGNILLKLGDSGNKLKGKHTFLSAYDWSTISTRDQVWIRKNSI